MATRLTKSSLKKDKTSNSAEFVSPLERLCALTPAVTPKKALKPVKPAKPAKPVKQTKPESNVNKHIGQEAINAVPGYQVASNSYKTRLIPLENGIDGHVYDAPQLVLPPLPQGTPPQSPPLLAPHAPPIPTAAQGQAQAQPSMQEMLQMLTSQIGNTFQDSLGRLNNSLLRGLDGLKEHMNSVTGQGDDEQYSEYDYGDQEVEDGEVRDDDVRDNPEMEGHMEQAEVNDSLSILVATIAKDDGVGSKLDSKLAATVQRLMRTKPEEKVVSELFASIKQPENCDALSQVVVNPCIWDKMPQESRNLDSRLQKVQLGIAKGATAVARMYDGLLRMANNGVEEAADILAHGNNALISLGTANVEMVQRRREAIKPSFDAEYAHLFHPTTSFTTALLGDDLSKQIKDITEDNKIINHVVKAKPSSARGKPYARGQQFRGRVSYSQRSRGSRGRPASGFQQDRPQPYRRPYQSQREQRPVRRGTTGRRS